MDDDLSTKAYRQRPAPFFPTRRSTIEGRRFRFQPIFYVPIAGSRASPSAPDRGTSFWSAGVSPATLIRGILMGEKRGRDARAPFEARYACFSATRLFASTFCRYIPVGLAFTAAIFSGLPVAMT